MSESFQKDEKARLARLAFQRWGVQGHVVPYQFAAEVLHPDVRESAIRYFADNGVKWWTSRWDRRSPEMELRPTGHLNSSQVACVNHLEPARVDETAARQVLRSIDPSLKPVRLGDDGYVIYEWIGRDNYLNETGLRTRGAHVTSLDALMCGENDSGRSLVAIEWKYLETYEGKSTEVSSRGTDRVATYRPLLKRADCPISVPDIRSLFYEPYDQLMRQTLLAWQMAEHREFEATDWIHVHVIPEGNHALRMSARGAPGLTGSGMAEKWRGVLRDPGRYRVLTPTNLVPEAGWETHWVPWRQWLAEAYLT